MSIFQILSHLENKDFSICNMFKIEFIHRWNSLFRGIREKYQENPLGKLQVISSMTHRNSHWTWPPLTLMQILTLTPRVEEEERKQHDVMGTGSFALGREGEGGAINAACGLSHSPHPFCAMKRSGTAWGTESGFVLLLFLSVTS